MKSVSAQGLAPISPIDAATIKLWLHGRPRTTAYIYEGDARRFLTFVGKPLVEVKLADLQAWAESMEGAAPATVARRLSTVKSLFASALETEMIPADPARALKVPKVAITTGDRVLPEAEVLRTIGCEPDPRKRAALRLLYLAGLRASEACGLSWRDLTGNDRRGGEAKVLGKGGKVRTVIIPADLWRELAALTPALTPDSPVLPGAGGVRLRRQALHGYIKTALKRAGANTAASAHWFRHSHASHALDNGCKVHVLAESLGHADLKTTLRYAHAKAGERSSSFIKG